MRRCFAARWAQRRCSSAAVVSVGMVFPSRPLCATTMFFSSTSIGRCAATSTSASEAPSTPAALTGDAKPAQHGSPNAGTDAAASALDLAVRVNKLKRQHQTAANGSSAKKQIEYTAWKELNLLTEEQINHAEGKAVALLLNSWAYFAKFWERGKDGPHGAHSGTGGGEAGASSGTDNSSSSSSH